MHYCCGSGTITQWNASFSKTLLHVYLLLIPLIKLTFCPTSHHLSPQTTESLVSPPACTNHDATGHPNLLLLCKGDGSTVGQDGFRAKVMSQSDSQQLPASLMVIYQQIPKDKPGGSPVKGWKSCLPILLCPTDKASPGLVQPITHDMTHWILMWYRKQCAQNKMKCTLTLYLLMWRIWWASDNATKGQMEFNLVF